MLYLDLDLYKLINETAGQRAGDRVICEIAPHLRRAHPEQAVLARTGGDEFAVVLPHSTLDDAERIGDSLLRTIAAVRFEHEARSYKISDRKSVVQGKSVSVRVDLGGRRMIKKKKQQTQ